MTSDGQHSTDPGNRARDRFRAAMSAELHTALHSVLGTIELLQTTTLDREQTEMIGSVHCSTAAMLAIVHDTLDLARIDLGEAPISDAPFLLHDLLHGCVDLHAHAARGKRISVRLDIDDSVPVSTCGDAVRVRQVCLSLLSFAIKATPAGSVTMVVRGLDGGVSFRVTDTGPGFGSASWARLLRMPPADGDDEPSARGLPGLALSVSKELIALMGGELSVESLVGRGTHFSFTLPLLATSLAPPGHQQMPLPPERSYKARVLVVDDTAGSRLVAQRMLQRLGCMVLTAENGAEAVQLAREHSFDLVMMDCLMPVLDGFDAARVIRAQGGLLASIPIVALSPDLNTNDRDRCAAAGMTEILEKPVRLRDLELMLLRQLPRGRATPPA